MQILPEPNMKKLILLDGHAIIHRAFHAIQPLTTSSGELINAIFGFTSILLNVLEIEKPDYLVATFDRKGPTFRHRADENYKATRTKAPDELIRQIRRVYEIVRAFNVPIFAQTGFEADDMIGTIAKQTESEENLQTIIVSGDRDLLQLVTDRVSVHDLTKGYRESVNFTPKEVLEKYGFEPKYLPDYKGLAGDASDNISGVAGVGTKTASGLIAKYYSLEQIYENLAEIKVSVREKLERDREQAFHSRRMATIRLDAPLEWDLAKCELYDFDRTTVLKLLAELEFHSLTRRFEKLFPLVEQKTESDATAVQQKLF